MLKKYNINPGKEFVTIFGKMKLKTRIFSFLLALSFFMATTGFSVYEHYCGGTLVDTSIYTSDNSCSPDHGEDNCSNTKKMDCCKDKMQFLKLDVEIKNSEINQAQFPFFALIVLSYNFIYGSDKAFLEKVEGLVPLPFIQKTLYIHNQQLTYYG